jgi:hypothetical protein
VKIGNVNLKGDVWNEISPGGKSMIKKMLTVDQKLRITCREALMD